MRWPWRARQPSPRVRAAEAVAAADIERARAARGEAERATKATRRQEPRVEYAVRVLREIHAENHFSEAMRSIFRST